MNSVIEHNNKLKTCKRLYEKYQECLQIKKLDDNIQCNIKLNNFFLKGCLYLDEYHNEKFKYLHP
jgi:hypothetical protein